jgi:hypothetical protein
MMMIACIPIMVYRDSGLYQLEELAKLVVVLMTWSMQIIVVP